MNAYCSRPALGPDGRFHMTWVWRDTPDCATNHDLSYARSADLVHWETGGGEPLKLPLGLQRWRGDRVPGPPQRRQIRRRRAVADAVQQRPWRRHDLARRSDARTGFAAAAAGPLAPCAATNPERNGETEGTGRGLLSRPPTPPRGRPGYERRSGRSLSPRMASARTEPRSAPPRPPAAAGHAPTGQVHALITHGSAFGEQATGTGQTCFGLLSSIDGCHFDISAGGIQGIKSGLPKRYRTHAARGGMAKQVQPKLFWR